MVCFQQFAYTFKLIDEQYWFKLLSKALYDIKVTIIFKFNTKEENLECKLKLLEINSFSELLSNTNEDFENIIVKVDTGRIWDQKIFWNMTPTLQETSEFVTKDAKTIYDFISGYESYHYLSIEQNCFIDFTKIRETLLGLNKIAPIKKLYCSPKSKMLFIYFESNHRIIVSEKMLCNSLSICFDLDDGFVPNAYDYNNATTEMINDFNKWNVDDNNEIEIFKLNLE